MGPTGFIMARKFPCFCADCLDGRFYWCSNLTLAGEFVNRTIKALKMREQRARFHTAEVEQNHSVPICIHGNRVFLGMTLVLIVTSKITHVQELSSMKLSGKGRTRLLG